MKRVMHRGACMLALGAVCAAEQDRFEEYQKIVFSMKLKNPDREIVNKIAFRAGLSAIKFKHCMDNPKTRQELANEITKAKSYGVKSTPTIFINKKRYKGTVAKDIFQRIIDMELEK